MRSPSALFLVLLTLQPLLGLSAQEANGWLRLSLQLHGSGVLFQATSELEDPGPGEVGRYGPEKLFDFDGHTAWSAGVQGAGLGEKLYMSVEPGVTGIGLRNGFARNRRLFEANNRPRFLRLTVLGALNVEGFATEFTTKYDAKPLTQAVRIDLEDRPTPQRIKLPFSWALLEAEMEALLASPEVQQMRFPQAREMAVNPEAPPPLSTRYVLEIELLSVYEGNRWEDSCIANLWPDYGPIAGICLSEERDAVVVANEAGFRATVYRGEGLVFEIAARSPESEWVVLRETEDSREPGRYRLINGSTGHDLTREVTREESPRLLGFEPGEEHPRLLVGKPGETVTVVCELYPFNEARR